MELHTPEGGIHSWRDFFVHMVTIVLGIMIAIGLEQSVEWVHHRHQREQLNADLRDEVQSNLEKERFDLSRGPAIRAYLLELRSAVDAKRGGQRSDVAPPQRPLVTMVHPLMAAWQAAKESGVVALLPAKEIRLYDRVLFQMERMDVEMEAFHTSSLALQSFEERFVDAPGGFDYGVLTSTPDISRMPADDLAEYSKLLSAEITALDRLMMRVRNMYAEDRALQEGATTEDELVTSARKFSDAR